jgi:hypothetical protein
MFKENIFQFFISILQVGLCFYTKIEVLFRLLGESRVFFFLYKSAGNLVKGFTGMQARTMTPKYLLKFHKPPGGSIPVKRPIDQITSNYIEIGPGMLEQLANGLKSAMDICQEKNTHGGEASV